MRRDQRGRLVRLLGPAFGELRAVGDKQEAIAVGMTAGLDQLAGLGVLVFKQDDFIVAGIIPGVVRRVLKEADQFARARLDISLAGGVKAVPVAGVFIRAGALPGVPRRGVAGADDDRVAFLVERGRLPGGAAAMTPGLDLARALVIAVGPAGGLRVAGRGGFLAVHAAHMPFHERAHPDLLAGVGVPREQLPEHAKFIAGRAVNQQHLAGLLVLDDERRAGHGIAGRVIAEFLLPDRLAGLPVQRHDRGVQQAHIDLVAIDGRAAVDHVATGADIVRQARRVLPELLAGLGVQGKHARIRGRDINDAVPDQRLTFLPALLLVAKRKRPLGPHLAHIGGIDPGQRAVPLRLQTHAVHQHIIRGLVIVLQIFPAYAGGQRRGRAERGEKDHRRAGDAHCRLLQGAGFKLT